VRTSLTTISLDFAGVVAPKDFIDYFWYYVIPRRLSKLERISLYEAMSIVDREYSSVPSTRLEWYLPSYWLRRFNIDASIKDLYEEALSVAEPYGDALEVVPRLARRFRIVIVTNTPKKMVEMFLSKYPQIGRHISRVFSCIDDFAMPKKLAEFYIRVIEELGEAPGRIMHIGDDRVHDFEEPIRAGMRALLIERSTRTAPTPTSLRSLYEVEELLEDSCPTLNYAFNPLSHTSPKAR